jgi:Alginate lyase
MKLTRRTFCAGAGATVLAGLTIPKAWGVQRSAAYQMVAKTDRERILRAAREYLPLEVLTITAFPSAKSPGGPHEFFSQADYFWPDPKNPDGPYVNRDGQSNPENFNKHREVMINLSVRMPAITAAWLLTNEPRYAKRAGDYLRAWFVTPATRMNPNLEFSQGVHGISTGRSYGIIDTLHLVEVARAASFLNSAALTVDDLHGVKEWFCQYLSWLKTSEKGQKERAALNNHATCWALQASEFARLIGDEGTRNEIRKWFTDTFLPDQLGTDGSFPRELARTKPYSYSIFNFDVMAELAQSLKGSGPDLTTFSLPDGRGLCKAAAFLYPYLQGKSKWPYKKDVEHFDALPVRSPGLLFAGLACHREEYIALWKTLNPDPADKEIIRNFPVRQPLLWV